jgi:hypothetical protein
MDNFSTPLKGSSTVVPRYCQKCGAGLGTTILLVGGLEFHPWCVPTVETYNDGHDIVVEALKSKISWLEYSIKMLTKDRDAAQEEVKKWRKEWEKERHFNCERSDRLDAAIDKLCAWVEEVRNEE